MKTIGFAGILRWYLVGTLVSIAIGVGMQAVMEITGGFISETSLVSSLLNVAMLIAMLLLGAAPLTLFALLMWLRVSRSRPVLEMHPIARFAGLTAVSAVISLVAGIVLTFRGPASPGEGFSHLMQSFTEDRLSMAAFFILFAMAIVLPRVVIRTLRGPVLFGRAG